MAADRHDRPPTAREQLAEAGVPIRERASTPGIQRLREVAKLEPHELAERGAVLGELREAGVPVRSPALQVAKPEVSPLRALAEAGVPLKQDAPHVELIAEAIDGDPGSGSPSLDREPCSQCDGDGVYGGQRCEACGGSGFAPVGGLESPSSLSGQRKRKGGRQRISDPDVVGSHWSEVEAPASRAPNPDVTAREAERQHADYLRRREAAQQYRELREAELAADNEPEMDPRTAMLSCGVPLKR
jgi:hypothetical protein